MFTSFVSIIVFHLSVVLCILQKVLLKKQLNVLFNVKVQIKKNITVMTTNTLGFEEKSIVLTSNRSRKTKVAIAFVIFVSTIALITFTIINNGAKNNRGY